MNVEASAPGKLVLLGEYAVLDGAPALAVAMPQRARVRLQPRAQGPSRLQASPLLDRAVEFDPASAGVRWESGLEPSRRARLDWIGALIAALHTDGRWPDGPVSLALDTRAFFGRNGKLGLGSSAALAVALSRAMVHHPGREGPAADLAQLVELHRRLQAGGGSGIDVAASLLGGVVRYRLDAEGGPQAQSVVLPRGLRLLALATGTPVSTPDAIAGLRHWAEAHPGRWQALRRGLAESAATGAESVQRGAAAVVEAIADYGRRLAELERATGLEIEGRAHAVPQALAREAGVVYKPSGAGGDLGIAASSDPERIERLRQRAVAAGVQVLPIDADSAGVRVGVRAMQED